MPDYASHLALIRQLRDLGAVKIAVGDVHVEFAGAPTPEPADEEAEPEMTAEQQRAEWERLQYFSSRG